MGMDKQRLRPSGAFCREGSADLARLPSDEELDPQAVARFADFKAVGGCRAMKSWIPRPSRAASRSISRCFWVARAATLRSLGTVSLSN